MSRTLDNPEKLNSYGLYIKGKEILMEFIGSIVL